VIFYSRPHPSSIPARQNSNSQQPLGRDVGALCCVGEEVETLSVSSGYVRVLVIQCEYRSGEYLKQRRQPSPVIVFYAIPSTIAIEVIGALTVHMLHF